MADITEITDTVTVEGPARPYLPAPPAVTATITADIRREYVAGGQVPWYQNAVRALSWGFDDVTKDFGDDVYEQMMHDPQCASGVNVLRAGILEDGAQLISAVTDEAEDGYALASEIRDFCDSALDDMETALDEVLWEMLSAIALGSRVAELTYGLVGGKLVPVSIKVKPRKATAFAVDAFYNVVGLLGILPGQPWLAQTGGLIDIQHQPNLLPREKFAVWSFRPVDGDPRGSSILRTAYHPWFMKTTVHPEYLKYLVQFASPSVWAALGPNPEVPAPDATGLTQTPEQALLAQILNWRNGTALVVRNGTALNLAYSSGDGKAFIDAYQVFNREITKAILHQALATDEGVHQSRAASSTHQDILDTLIRQTKKGFARMVRRDILRPMVRYNYGDGALPLVPFASFGVVEQQDMSTVWTALSQLMSAGYLDPSQLPGTDEIAGLPVRTTVEAPETPDTPGAAEVDDTVDE